MVDEVLSWVDPDGTVTVLNDGSLEVGWDMQGRYMPPVDYIEDDVPGHAGARLREVRVRPREVALPVDVFVTDTAALRVLMRTLMRTFNPQRGPGKLRIRSADGTTRDLNCRYRQGLELQEQYEAAHGVQRTVIVLRAVDPFWYDTAPTSTTYTLGAATKWFPIFPLTLGSDTVFGTQTINNTGDVETFPVWTVHGPCTSLVLNNTTTGDTIELPITLTAAQTVTIDTRPFRKTVTRDDGTNLYGSLTTTSVLWALPIGLSTITVDLPGAGVESYVTLVYSRRWLSP